MDWRSGRAPRPVYLVLLTRGENGGLIDVVNGGCDLSSACPAGYPGHRIQLSPDDVVAARTAEFTAAARRPGVDKVINMRQPDGAWTDYPASVDYVRGTILDFETRRAGTRLAAGTRWATTACG
ncbi:PIG-L family deacetylase [Crossiella sp. SN42]|uniref:PIG-L family deacetylase n=1 Tax=Crossiella sp. SN42 TaxID=2944808 RepID=UPI00207C8C24|nr:PIG-L family deacetylase [Crossiella sp. SN42]MCO1577817.1 PIG-L family deacetylase [Crossiella sp. SN42]